MTFAETPDVESNDVRCCSRMAKRSECRKAVMWIAREAERRVRKWKLKPRKAKGLVLGKRRKRPGGRRARARRQVSGGRHCWWCCWVVGWLVEEGLK
ncbi:hypothetical protein HDK77DRAFT_489501 [Phyllosticta capitalensis]|uniref:uncharacterized protein n=1 Tax=Phyllosticta capitalensis TaxID=121624 RepID=UPI003131E5ED